MTFRDVVTVNFQGTTIAFARVTGDLHGVAAAADPTARPRLADTPDDLATDICFNVLALDVDSQRDALDWNGFERLRLPDAVRPAGMSLINVPVEYNATAGIDGLADAGVPFRAVASGDYIYLVRQAKRGTLLVNRLRLVRDVVPGTNEARYRLEPAWEVRFQRSGKPDVPADDSDTQSYRSLDDVPFLEPAFELTMVGDLVDGNFDVALLQPGDAPGLMFSVVVVDAPGARLELYELPLDANGLFDLGRKSFVAGRIPPDVSFRLADHAGQILALAGRPAAAFYLKQERVLAASGDSFLVKRSGRLLIAAQSGTPATLATVDLGIALDATVARPADPLTVAAVGVANYALDVSASAYVKLPAWAPSGGFSAELWIYPRSSDPDQQILGSLTDPDAPAIKLVSGSAIELRFVGVNGQPFTARTALGVVRQLAWTRVQVSFDPAGNPRAAIRINGDPVPVAIDGTGDQPGSRSIDAVSAPQRGFIGAVDKLSTFGAPSWDPAHAIGSWPFDAITYGQEPPTTPNTVAPSAPGLVYGARQVPSTSPVGNPAPALSWDSRGLSIAASVFADLPRYGELRSSPALLAGSDGLLHCYFRGKSDSFSAMQLDTEVARATFATPWHTAAAAAEVGIVQLVATQPGSFMNSAAARIEPADAVAPATFCDVTFTSPAGRSERWYGVPRSLLAFSAVLNGDALRDPSDSRVAAGARGYFDATGTRPAAYVPVPNSASAACVALVSRMPAQLPLAAIAIDRSGAAATVTLDFATPRWPGHSGRVTWPAVPARATELLTTLAGLATDYDYGRGTSTVASYSLVATSELVAANRVVLFVRPTVERVERIEVAPGEGPQTCDVTIELVDHGAKLGATWRGVSRVQTTFAATLEGIDPDYDYAKHASGDWSALGAALIITTDGSSAQVADVHRGDGTVPVPPDDDLRVAASLLAVFATATVEPAEAVESTVAPIVAAAFQRAVLHEDGRDRPLLDASTIFRALPATAPATGAVGLVADAAAAVLATQGSDGGWRNQPPDRTVALAWDGWVAIPTAESQSPNITQLMIQGDLTLELWCAPVRSREDKLVPNQRLVTFSRTPALGEQGDPVRYLAGLRDCPSLVCAKNTRVRTGFRSTNGSLAAWFYPTDATPPAGVIGSISTLGLVAPVFELGLNADRKLQLRFVLEPSQPPIVAPAPIPGRTWHQAVATYATTTVRRQGKIDYTFDVVLHADGVRVGTARYTKTVDGTQPIDLATIVLGDITSAAAGLPMLANEIAYFERVLTDDDVERFVEQRIPDNTDGLVVKWMLRDGTGNNAHNTASSGPAFDGKITPIGGWREWGLYTVPVLGHGTNIAILDGDPLIHGWTHLALVHQAGYALQLDGRSYGNAGSASDLALGETCSVEAWVELDDRGLRAPQVAVAKGDDYELAIDPDGRPRVRFRVDVAGDPTTLEVVAPDPVPAHTPTYLAASYELITIGAASGTAQVPRYEVHIDLYVNGVRAAWGVQDPANPGHYLQYADAPTRLTSDAPVNLGRTSLLGGTSYLRGKLADVRLWSRKLVATEIAKVWQTRRAPADRDGIVSYWRFAEPAGKTALDSGGQNNARLDRADLRRLYPPTANNWFYVNAAPAVTTRFVDDPLVVGGYGSDDQIQFGKVTGTGGDAGFFGKLDEIRVWAAQRTGEQLADNMNQRLAGNEPALRGYWSFDNGSGSIVDDNTGRGNAGVLAGTGAARPTWGTSDAPLANEAPVVFNILGGVPTFAQLDIEATPAVVEYADVQRDAYGVVFSVMKRAYVAIRGGKIDMTTGFKVGDLDTVYLGQAQSRPSLIGFIEGAPPLPSENQTMPYWRDGSSAINAYARASSVTLKQADDVTYSYSSDRDYGEDHTFRAKAGVFMGAQWETSAGIGFEVANRTVVIEGHLGLQAGFDFREHDTGNVKTDSGTHRTQTTALAPAGSWEPGKEPSRWVNPTVGRRYVPNNNGVALVKSVTVDLYASILRTTGSMVKLTQVPNPNIPADVNLIDFPIDPKYVKNGTLDGKVGLANDPSYLTADRERGSYFRPLEAYGLKRRIERETAQLAATYAQLSPESRASKLRDDDAWSNFRNSSRTTDAYDWNAHLSRRSIANTYVWSAGGGTHAEEAQLLNVYSESYGAISGKTASVGAVSDLKVALPWLGPYGEIDYLYTWGTTVTATKTRQEGASFELATTVNPDSYLYAPRIDGSEVTFPDSPTEGKVDGYRYLAFYLAPNQDNATQLFDRVVDRRWLAGSSAAAAALREATVSTGGAWRVLYRVTYVSRIPPKFQPVPATTQPRPLQPPVNLAYNALLVKLVESQITALKPTPVEIGAAIAKVLGTPGAPGLIVDSLPWWPEFLDDSHDYQVPAAAILRTLREDLLQYMVARYAARPTDSDV